MPVTPSSGSSSEASAITGAGPTAQDLIRGMGNRLSEFILSVPTGPGSTTTLVDARLKQFFPTDIPKWFGWMYAAAGADASNVGLEYRGQSWTTANSTITLMAPGFPTGITQGPYEIHMRFQRSKILEAINDAVGQLQLSWYREVEDTSLVTAEQKWEYVAPATELWTNINKVEIQINTDPLAVAGGYPYAPADQYNPRIERAVTVAGVETWVIRFGNQPPPGRILRLRGEAYYNDLVLDSDFLPLGGTWRRPAMSWIYSWAAFQLQDWTNNRTITDATEKARTKALDLLERQKNQLLATAPPHKPGKIITPGRGDGYPVFSPNDSSYLGAFRSATFSRGGS